jgi:hypothetical protein
MTLLEQTSVLRQRVTSLDAVRAKIAEVAALQARHSEAQQLHSALSSVVAAVGLLRGAAIMLPVPPAAAGEARRRLTVVRDRFSADAKAAALTKGQDWDILIRNTKETTAAIQRQIQDAWRSYVESLYTGDTPNNMGATVAKTDRNDEVLSRYRSAFEQFQCKAQTFPNSREEINEAQILAGHLKTIVREFDLQVPASVKRFLDAVSQNKAGLDLATDEVIEWLKDNGTFDRYKIIAARQ